MEEASIRWVPLFFTSQPPLLSKMYDRWRMIRKARQLHDKESFDIIHCRSYVSAEAGFRLKKATGTKFLFDMRGLWADEKVDCGQWDQRKWVYRKLYTTYKKKEKQFLLSADAIVSLTESGRNYLLAQPGYQDLPIEMIPCCADLAHFDFNKISPDETNNLKKELGIETGKKVITYLGSIGGWYMTTEMFSFYKRLLIRHPEFVFMILTKDEPGRVTAEINEAGLNPENFIIRYAGRSEVPLFLSLSDISIFFIRPSFSKIASSPTKHAELMGMGIPVICNEIGDTGNIIRATGTGLITRSFSDAEYDEVIAKLPEQMSISKSAIRNAAFDFFDLKKGVESYAMLYKKLQNQVGQ